MRVWSFNRRDCYGREDRSAVHRRAAERTAEVVIAGERVEDVTTHPALRNGVETLASLLDLQHDPALREEMTYVSPTSGEWVGLSFPHAPNRQGPGAAAYDDGPLG